MSLESELFVATMSAFMGGLIARAYSVFRGERVPEPVAKEPHCTGYTGKKYGDEAIMTDCDGLRSVTCSDGRCSYHCARMCKCDAPNYPEVIDLGKRKRA